MPSLRESLDEEIQTYIRGDKSWFRFRDQAGFLVRENHAKILAKTLADIGGDLEAHLNDVKVAVATFAANTATVRSTGLTRLLQVLYEKINSVEKSHALVVREVAPAPLTADNRVDLPSLPGSPIVAPEPTLPMLKKDDFLLTAKGLEGYIAQNYYQRLSLQQTATADQIKRHYYQLCRFYHPDHNRDHSEPAAAVFTAVSQAYETLSDPALRYRYDSVDMVADEAERVDRQKRHYKDYRPNASVCAVAAAALSMAAVRSNSRGGAAVALVSAAAAAGMMLWGGRKQRAVTDAAYDSSRTAAYTGSKF